MDTDTTQQAPAPQDVAPQEPKPRRARRPTALGWFTRSRFTGLYLLGLVALVVSTALRATLGAWVRRSADLSAGEVAGIFTVGALFDVVAYVTIAAPVAVVLALIPDRLLHRRLVRWLLAAAYGAAVLAIVALAAVEMAFFEAFGARLNFLALDYLIYTPELRDGLTEGWPVRAVAVRVVAAAGLILAVTAGVMWRSLSASGKWPRRWAVAAGFVIAAVLSWLFVDASRLGVRPNRFNTELSRNGLYSLVAAYRSGALDYRRYYLTDKAAGRRLKEQVAQDNARPVGEMDFDLARDLAYPGPEQRYNIVILVIESLGARDLGAFGGKKKLTRNLDALCADGLLYSNVYAAGTTTARALDAIVLSIPPIPGRSLASRPDRCGLLSLATVLGQRGYDTLFAYGGSQDRGRIQQFLTSNGFESVSAGAATF